MLFWPSWPWRRSGLLVARRVTRRVARLHTAARPWARGSVGARGPQGQRRARRTGRAFDRMVAELGQARSRLEYLQKVSAWQEVARRLAHEIKNPLMPIQLAVQEIASKYLAMILRTGACWIRHGDPA